MTVESAHQFSAQLSDSYGIDYSKLGAVMLEVEGLDLKSIAPGIEADLYSSPNAERFWIRGDVISEHAHITLRYGLLQPAYEHKDDVDLLLADINLRKVYLDHISQFPSTFQDEDYTCLVAAVAVNRDIELAHNRLGYLPHVNTFPDYRPHVTIAYVTRESASHWAREFENVFPASLNVTELSYGKKRL